MPLTTKELSRLVIVAAILLLPLLPALGQADPYRGLWVGQVNLSRVNEVTVPLDKNNVPIAPDPKVPTPTADAAQLRVILHVNGAGQASLLKDVAILNRTGTSNVLARSDSDVALVTDERLYPEFPPQPAIRHASAVFDFGDSRATDGVNAVAEAAALAAANSVANSGSDPTTSSATRQSVQASAYQAAKLAAGPIVASADVATAFTVFLSTNDNFKPAGIDALAGGGSPASALLAASNLQARSFYADGRAIEMILAVVDAVQDAATRGLNKTNAAQNTAASFADVTDEYQRFIGGKHFGDMIAGAAEAAALAATNNGATTNTITAMVLGNSQVVAVRNEALSLQLLSMYRDTRSTNAVMLVVNAIIDSAVTSLTNSVRIKDTIQTAAEAAGRDTLAAAVPRFEVSAQVPTPEYNDFVRSSTNSFPSTSFTNSAELAAQAAAQGAVSERVNNPLYTAQSLQNAARVAAVQALQGVYGAAARAVRNELPLAGRFGPGQGDPRLTWENKAAADVLWKNVASLSGTIYLPANHPTNPFRHRRHPDHTAGFDIRRRLSFDFDGTPTNALARAGFGVDRITGTYREEIFGLHKPLGPQKDTGLRVEGTFQLNRISLIDTLNAR